MRVRVSALRGNDAFELPQLALAESPGRRVHGRRQVGQRALGVGAQARLGPAFVIEQASPQRGISSVEIPGRVWA